MKEFLIILFGGFIFTKFIKIYNKTLIKLHNDKYVCYDIMNQKIATILGFKMCIWNFIHIILYFSLCLIFKAHLNFKIHFLISMIGLSWLLLCPFKEKNNLHSKCQNTVYEDIYIPRNDDLFFNTLGQVIYILLYKWNIIQYILRLACNMA